MTQLIDLTNYANQKYIRVHIFLIWSEIHSNTFFAHYKFAKTYLNAYIIIYVQLFRIFIIIY